MEYKVDLERAMLNDLVKPSRAKRYRAAIYALTAVSSIVLGALAMALFIHWNEIQTMDNRSKIQDVKEVIRMTDVLLTKHETNAANVEKLLTRFEHKLQSIESKLQQAKDRSELNLTHDETNDINQNQQTNRADGNGWVEVPESTVSPTDAKMRESNMVEILPTVASIDTQLASSELAPHDGKPSSESFQWEWSFPQSAWLKLSPFGLNYGTAKDNAVESEKQQ